MGKSNKTIKKTIVDIYAKMGVLIVLLVMCIILALATDTFLQPKNLINVVRQIAFYAMIGLGSMCIIVTGGIDMSPGSVVGLVSVLVALNGARDEGSVALWLIITIAVGAVFGFVNGGLVAYFDMPPFIVTLGTQIVGRGVALLITDGRPVSPLNSSLEFLGGGKIGFIPTPIILLIICSIVTWYILKYMKIGRHLYAIGGNQQAARVSGVNVKHVKLFAYMLASVLAAIAGLSLTGRVASGQPSLGDGYELFAIAGAVIGGTSLSGGVGSVYGVICGSLVIGVLNNGMNLLGMSGYWQQVAQGTIIILAVLLDLVRKRSKV